jgi:hypothetical protein
MANDFDFTPVINFLTHVFQRFRGEHPKSGKPYTYAEVGMRVFFMTMFLKRIFAFQAMARYAAVHYGRFGFAQAPSRQTMRRRFYALPALLQRVIPMVADEAIPLDERLASEGLGFIDKCLFWAKGGVWHKKQMNAGIVPLSTIDTEATWGYPPYRKRWVFGYGLHAIVNRFRFPLSAGVTTASAKDDRQVSSLLAVLPQALLILIGDKGYRVIMTIKRIFKDFQTFVLTQKPYKRLTDMFTDWYSKLIATEEAITLYWRRKPSVEPCFSLIKELFDLTDRKPLPYKGLKKNQCFLLMTVVTIQCLMIFNSIYGRELRSLSTFKTLMT